MPWSQHGLRSVSIAVLLALMCACTGSQPEGNAEGPSPEAPSSPSPLLSEEAAPACDQLDELAQRVARGYVAHRGADIVPIPAQETFIGGPVEPVHTGPWDHLSNVPLVAYGPGVVRPAGRIQQPATMADLAPTVARMVGYRFRTRDGAPISGVVEDGSRPRLVVVVVWDGGGWNVLRRHRDEWPFLRRMMKSGAWLDDFEIGSTPSNTPPIHTTLGTGVFPSRHGIPGVRMMVGRDGDYVDPFLGDTARFVEAPSLADLYDRDRGNEPKIGLVGTVNWHLGMIGHGAALRGADKDVAVLLGSSGELFGDPATYELSPSPDPGAMQRAIERLDASDGSRDGKWENEDLGDPPIRAASPAWVRLQQGLLEDTIDAHRFGRDRVPDLLFTNFKMIDDAGHKWAPFSRQTAAAVAASDAALKRLTHFLDATVGRRRWAVLLTADHGQQPLPRDTGIFPVQPGPLGIDVNARFDDNENGQPLVQRVAAAGLFVDLKEAGRLSVKLEDVARWLIDYRAEDNKKPGEPLPKAWQEDPGRRLFAGVVVGKRLVADACG